MKRLLKKVVQYYLWTLAKLALWRHNPDIIAITGSTWRQTIKEEVFQKLSLLFRVRFSPKNYNAEIGVPLSILGLAIEKGSIANWLKILFIEGPKTVLIKKSYPQKLILELAINQPRDMDYLISLVRPRITVVTNITSEYLDNFGSLDNVAKEYAKLIKATPTNGLIILNNDDLRLRQLQGIHPKIVSIGMDSGAQIYPENIIQNNEGQRFRVKINNEMKEFILNKFGVHHVYAAIVAQIIINYYKIEK